MVLLEIIWRGEVVPLPEKARAIRDVDATEYKYVKRILYLLRRYSALMTHKKFPRRGTPTN